MSLKTQAVLLFTTVGQQEVVSRCCLNARRAGVSPGMSVAEARALCPAATRLPFDGEKNQKGLALLAQWCHRFSPVVAVDPTAAGNHPDDFPDGLLLDVTGEAHLFGSERLLLTDIALRLQAMGVASRLAIAPTIGAAWALSRFAPEPMKVITEETLTPSLEKLPIASMRLPASTCEALHQVGIETVRHLLKLPRESLLTRFGEDLLMRLDQAFGRIPELIEPLRITEPLAVQRIFDGAAIQLEAILITIQELIEALCKKLESAESGVRGLRLEWIRFNAAPVSREFVLGRPTRDAKHLWKLVRPKAETMHLGYGVERIAIVAYWTEKIRHEQMGAWGLGDLGTEAAHDQEYAGFLDTLVSRWGKESVLAAKPVAAYVPETARQFVPVQDSSKDPAPLLRVDRPSVLFDHPEPAQAMALQPDHAPSWLKWRGEEHQLTRGIGPERIVTAWWGKNTVTARDYFKVRTHAAHWLWVFREVTTGRWFVHGIWA